MNTLEEIALLAKKCQKCRLHQNRIQAVPGSGNPSAEIVFIGEAPGANEDKNGIPFCGAAGRVLDELLQSIGIKREDVFIANMVKCRPPENRDPQPDELDACSPYLEKQLEIINPKVVITLGRFSMARFLPEAKISHVHGQKFAYGELTLIPMYHPAAGLYRGEVKKLLLEDFAKLPDYLQEVEEARKEREKIEQVGLV